MKSMPLDNRKGQKQKKTIRIGVAGLGRIGWSFHCAQIAGHGDFQLAAVTDRDEARCREAEETHQCAAFKSYDAMVRRGSLDAVVIATPTHLHKTMALSALRNGLHVFLEKPMAPNVRDARIIVEAATQAKKVLTIYQPHRAAAYFQHLLKIIDSGKIGAVYHIRRGAFGYVRRDDWQSLRKYGGGMLSNYGAHYLDQLLNLTGSKVKRVFCQLRQVATLGDADDVVKIIYETGDGVTAELDINMGSAIAPYELEVYGTRGAIVLSKQVFTVRFFSAKELPRKQLNPDLASEGRKYPADKNPFHEKTIPVDPRLAVDVYADLAKAIRTGCAPFVQPRETLALMEVMEQCRKDSGGIVDSR